MAQHFQVTESEPISRPIIEVVNLPEQKLPSPVMPRTEEGDMHRVKWAEIETSTRHFPRLLHRIWLGPESMPKPFATWGRKWDEMHADWLRTDWDEERARLLLRKFPQVIQDAFADAPSWAEKADILRVCILYRYGGVYVDCDVEPMRNITPLLSNNDAFVGLHVAAPAPECNNAVMGGLAGHALWVWLLEELPRRSAQPQLYLDGSRNVAATTGPALLTEGVAAMHAKGVRVTVFDRRVFYPYSQNEPQQAKQSFPDAFAIHRWAMSWTASPNAEFVEVPLSDGPLLIPKILHTIWLGPKPMPERDANFVARWRALHPDFEHRHWTEADVDTLGEWPQRKLFDSHEFQSGRANMLRYEILKRFGGIYVDTDFEPLQDITPLLGDTEFFAAWQDEQTINNAIIGSVPDHAIWNEVIAGIPDSIAKISENHKASPYLTGPYYWTPIVAKYAKKNPKGIKLFGKELFYPYPWFEAWKEPSASEFPDAFAIHRWTLSALELPSASVIIPTSGDTLRLEWVLEGLLQQSHKRFEVFIVNDGKAERDEDLRKLVSVYDERLNVKYLYLSPDTPDFRAGAARNHGARHSSGDVLLFLDEDCVPDVNWVHGHLILHACAKVGGKPTCGIGPRRRLPLELVSAFSSTLNYEELHQNSTVDAGRRVIEPIASHWVTCNSSAGFEVFSQAGGFDEALVGWGAEDTNCGRTMEALGARFCILPNTSVTHLDHEERPKSADWIERCEKSKRGEFVIPANGEELKRA